MAVAFVSFFYSSCRSMKEKKIIRSIRRQYIYTAWNEDTLNSIKFLPLKDGRFVCQVITKEQNPIYFLGIYKEKSDTIFLTFDKPQSDWKSFLIKEISNQYLIQQYKDDKRIFLRIHRRAQR